MDYFPHQQKVPVCPLMHLANKSDSDSDSGIVGGGTSPEKDLIAFHIFLGSLRI